MELNGVTLTQEELLDYVEILELQCCYSLACAKQADKMLAFGDDKDKFLWHSELCQRFNSRVKDALAKQKKFQIKHGMNIEPTLEEKENLAESNFQLIYKLK